MFVVGVEKRANRKIPSPYKGVDFRIIPTIVHILKTISRTTLSPAFLLYHPRPCSSEDEIGECCSHMQISEVIGGIEKCLCNSTHRLLLALNCSPLPCFDTVGFDTWCELYTRPPLQVDPGYTVFTLIKRTRLRGQVYSDLGQVRDVKASFVLLFFRNKLKACLSLKIAIFSHVNELPQH